MDNRRNSPRRRHSSGPGLVLCVERQRVYGRDAAAEAALADAGFTRHDVTRLDTDFERDDGFVYYDVKFINGTMEYDYTIDASTGAVLHSEMEPVFD